MDHSRSYDFNLNINATALADLIRDGISILTLLQKDINTMANELSDLQVEVTNMHGTVDSAVVLIQGIAARIDAAAGDPVALQALTDSLRADDQALAAAVAADSAPVVTP